MWWNIIKGVSMKFWKRFTRKLIIVKRLDKYGDDCGETWSVVEQEKSVKIIPPCGNSIVIAPEEAGHLIEAVTEVHIAVMENMEKKAE